MTAGLSKEIPHFSRFVHKAGFITNDRIVLYMREGKERRAAAGNLIL